MNNSLRSLLLVIISFTATAAGANFSSSQTSSPRIDGISAPTLGRAGRLRIFGSNFGAIQAGSQLLIDGKRAPVSRWSDSLIVAYVPDTARIGPVSVQVINKRASSNSVQLDVNGGDDPDCGAGAPAEIAAEAEDSLKLGRSDDDVLLSWGDAAAAEPCILYRVYVSSEPDPERAFGSAEPGAVAA